MPKTIIVTGASSGIGRALSKHLAELDHCVIAIARNKVELESLQKLYPNNIKIVTADINNKEDQLRIKNVLLSTETGIFLVHNAGIAIPRLITDISEKEWDNHYLTNMRSPFFLTKLLLPHLKNGGRVLNISTGLAHSPLAGMSAYGISKTAFLMFKEYCNLELNEQGVSFASAMPGVVNTQIQTQIRSLDIKAFPSVELFKGFFQRDELLSPETAAKFLSWLLLETTKEAFTKGDWSIYDTSHHSHWAKSGEIKHRQSVPKNDPPSHKVTIQSKL